MKLQTLLEQTNVEPNENTQKLAIEYIQLSNDKLQELIDKNQFNLEWKKQLATLILEHKIEGLSGIVFDLEATCQDKKIDKFFDNEVIEIGAVKVLNGIIVSDFAHFVRPKDTVITPFCTTLTTITKEDVEGAKNFPTVLTQFKSFAGDLPVLSWGLYDKKQLVKDIKRHKLNQNLVKWLETKHRSLKHEHGEAFNLNGGRGVGTERALQMCGETLEGTHHRGIDDAYNIAKIFIKNKDIFMK